MCEGALGVKKKKKQRYGLSESATMMLPGLSSNQPEVQIIEDGRSLVAHGDPILIYEVIGCEINIGPSEGLLEGVPLECGYYMVL